MKPKMPFAERHKQRRIAANIFLQAEGAAEQLLDQGAASYFFNAGPAPGGELSPEIFSQEVGNLAIQLVATEMDPTVAYDHEASLQATDRIRATRAEGRLPASLDPVIVVFTPLSEPRD